MSRTHNPSRQHLTIASAAPECCAKLRVVVGKIKHRLGEVRGLHDAPDLNGAFIFNEFSDRVQKGC